jgi:carbonic anhydrase/acetyltransferase-like protein (isoleucine patch superfamily)
VVGDVTIGERSSVWFNTVVRGDTAPVTVGVESNLQDNTVVHVDEGQPAIIGNRVTVGHRAIVHGCVIEDECLIGMGAIVLSGAVIGAGSLIGAGALVLEGQKIPAGSTALGMPAKVTGQVRPEHRESIRRGASHYVALARSYRERGIARPLSEAGSDAGLSRTDPGPMAFFEWAQRLDVIAETPRWVADRMTSHPETHWRERPAAERWSAIEVLCHLRDVDREIFAPRLERLLSGGRPTLEGVDLTGPERVRGYRSEAPAAVHRQWTAIREGLLARLRPLRPGEWERTGTHPRYGPYSLAEMIRRWAEHDLSHRRQLAEALGEFA